MFQLLMDALPIPKDLEDQDVELNLTVLKDIYRERPIRSGLFLPSIPGFVTKLNLTGLEIEHQDLNQFAFPVMTSLGFYGCGFFFPKEDDDNGDHYCRPIAGAPKLQSFEALECCWNVGYTGLIIAGPELRTLHIRDDSRSRSWLVEVSAPKLEDFTWCSGLPADVLKRVYVPCIEQATVRLWCRERPWCKDDQDKILGLLLPAFHNAKFISLRLEVILECREDNDGFMEAVRKGISNPPFRKLESMNIQRRQQQAPYYSFTSFGFHRCHEGFNSSVLQETKSERLVAEGWDLVKVIYSEDEEGNPEPAYFEWED